MRSESNIGGSIRRSRAILRAALGAFRRNPRLAWFPVLSGFGLLALVALGAIAYGIGHSVASEPIAELGPLWAMFGDPDPDRDTALVRALAVGGITFYAGGNLLMVWMGVAMTHAALESLAGRPWTVRQSLRVASQRKGAIVTFALVRATVGHLLHGRGKRDGKKSRRSMLTRLAQHAWWAATYLVLPVIARENRSGLGAIQRSASLLRETWKETLVARLTLGWLWIPVVIVGAVPAVLCAVLQVREPMVIMAAVAVPVAAFGIFGLFLRTLDGIYRAALYSYATEGVVPDAFADHELDDIWEVPGRPEPDEEPSSL